MVFYGRQLECVRDRVPSIPTSTIVGGGISPSHLSAQMTNATQATMVLSVSSSMPLIIGSTHPSSATPSLSLIYNDFSFGMPSIGMQNVSTNSRLITQKPNFWEGIYLTCNVFLGVGGISLHRSLHPKEGIFHLLGLIQLWD
jgi:hypothetical protein